MQNPTRSSFQNSLHLPWILLSAFSFLQVVTPTAQAYYQSTHHQQKVDYWRQYPDTTGLCTAPGFKRNETDCTQFYRCVDFNPKDYKEIYTVFRFRCGPGTVFDESSSICTWPHLANPPCTNEYLPTTIYSQIALTTLTYPTYRPTTYPTAGPTTQIYTNPNNIKWQGTTHKPPLRWTDNTALCRAPGFKRNEKDCTQFYRCVDFNPKDYKEIYTVFKFRCGPGTVFDEGLSVCTWPHLATPPCPNEYRYHQSTTIYPYTIPPKIIQTQSSTTISQHIVTPAKLIENLIAISTKKPFFEDLPSNKRLM